MNCEMFGIGVVLALGVAWVVDGTFPIRPPQFWFHRHSHFYLNSGTVGHPSGVLDWCGPTYCSAVCERKGISRRGVQCSTYLLLPSVLSWEDFLQT